MEEKLPIVVVAFNRLESLKRLLKSLQAANYPGKDITLIISIDKGDNQQILKAAQEFQWKHGAKEVIYQENNLGLREHILRTGDLSLSYGNVLVLEDDLYVAPDFYNYALQALAFCSGNSQLAGISLYNHQFNQHSRENFNPVEDGYDNWYFQYASSWGQVWSKKQWERFRTWYDQNHEQFSFKQLPQNIQNWSEKSWLKYFIGYVVENELYFLYPKISLTTNFNDQGTHINSKSTVYQVPLFFGKGKQYNFSTLFESQSKYDVYFENMGLASILKLPEIDLCVDLYGSKSPRNQRYWLSIQAADYKILSTFALDLKPRDMNVILGIPGKQLFLYDRQVKLPFSLDRPPLTERILYNLKELHYSHAFRIFKSGLIARIVHNFKKVF